MTGEALSPPVFQLKTISLHFLLSILEKRRGTRILRMAQQETQVVLKPLELLLSSFGRGWSRKWARGADGPGYLGEHLWSLDESLPS